MDEKALQKALIKLTGIFPDEMNLFKEWMNALKSDAIKGALGHRETDMALRFLGRYSAIEDVLNYMDEVMKK